LREPGGSIPLRASMSNQNVETPADLIAAIEERFGPLTLDLAADGKNHKAPNWLGPGGRFEDSLSAEADWTRLLMSAWGGGNGWLNNPYTNTPEWVKKCWATIAEPGAYGFRILQLIPAAVCTNYFVDFVNEYAYRIELTPRPFLTEARDCVLIVWTPEQLVGRETWKWRD